MLSKLEGSLSKVIIDLSALLDRIKDEVHLQKAEFGRIELQKVLSFIFKHFQPELVEKLAQIGLKDIIGKSNWERAQEDHERSQWQEIRRGPKL